MDTIQQTAGGLGEILQDKLRAKRDLRMISRAARERWPMPAEKREAVVAELLEIVQQQTTTRITEDGKSVEVSNASTQVAAARVLASMDAINQTDYWNQDKNDRLDSGKPTELAGVVQIQIPGLPAPSTENQPSPDMAEPSIVDPGSTGDDDKSNT